ncbi:MAG: HPP family protein [Bacteroidota bacterium]
MGALRRFFLTHFVADAAPLSAGERWRSAIAGLFGILLLEAILTVLPVSAEARRLLAPAGASAVILFSLPHSPLGQPWSVVGGLGISAVVGYCCGQWIALPWLAVACAVAISIWLMATWRCLHPPGGAMAIVMASLSSSGAPPLSTVATNVAGLLVGAMVVNNLLKGRAYPQCSSRPPAVPAVSLRRSGIEHQDLSYAFAKMDTYLDISESDLVAVYNLAAESAFRRHSKSTCGELMTTEVIAIEFATELDEAWHLLRSHHHKALPVLDRARHVIGLLTLDDFLKHVPAHRHDGIPVAESIRRFLQPTPGINSQKPEVAGQIMERSFITLRVDDDLATVARLLSSRQHPLAIPVLDAQSKLAGILSQSDVAVALYHRLALGQAGESAAADA